ncbi:hypothetical protein L6R52_11315 [Myxococcota bacterium]|nr:hypothetical protein [Myxococcota bacterium]
MLSQLIQHLEGSGATGDALTEKLAEQVGHGALALATGGNTYAATGAAAAPCQSCVRLAEGLGLSADVFLLPGQQDRPTLRAAAESAARGAPLPGAGAAHDAAPTEHDRPKPWWKRLFGL